MALSFDEINRVITVEAPAVEITMQELINGIRDYEDEWYGIDIPKVADASGKEALGGGVLVGITVTLIDWKLKFEDRAGPDYIICNATGGNLVTFDTGSQLYINPIEPAAYVTVVITASSSATLQELGAIQYASFGGGVTVDVLSPYSGIEFPVGTPQEPVNNLSDAMTIANERGFTTFYIIGDITIDTSGDYEDMVFIGESQTKSILTVSSGANVTGCEFKDATVLGTLDGNSLIQNCVLSDLEYVYGIIVECILEPGTITLGGTNPAHFLDCWCGDPDDVWPTVDCGGAGQALALQNYNGRIKLINKTGTEQIQIALNAGHVWLDSTVTNGDIYIKGVGELDDDGSATVDATALISNASVADAVWDEPLSDHQTAGSAGQLVLALLGIGGENVKWSAISHDANNNMTGATITQYTDNTLVTPLKSWIFTATYNANSEMTYHELKEV